jgi:hypothetical protein
LKTECAMNQKQRKTLAAIFTDPVRANIAWKDVEAMLAGLGASIKEGSGSRVRVELNGIKTVFHEPHPEKEICKAMVRAVREFLLEADIIPTNPDAE